MNSKIIQIVVMNATDLADFWQGSILALHEDGSLSLLEPGQDGDKPAVKAEPVKVF